MTAKPESPKRKHDNKARRSRCSKTNAAILTPASVTPLKRNRLQERPPTTTPTASIIVAAYSSPDVAIHTAVISTSPTIQATPLTTPQATPTRPDYSTQYCGEFDQYLSASLSGGSWLSDVPAIDVERRLQTTGSTSSEPGSPAYAADYQYGLAASFHNRNQQQHQPGQHVVATHAALTTHATLATHATPPALGYYGHLMAAADVGVSVQPTSCWSHARYNTPTAPPRI